MAAKPTPPAGLIRDRAQPALPFAEPGVAPPPRAPRKRRERFLTTAQVATELRRLDHPARPPSQGKA